MTNNSVIEIIAPYGISDATAEKLANKFANILGIRFYEKEVRIDESLIGGIIVFAGGYRFDFSVRGELERTVKELKYCKRIPEIALDDDKIPELVKNAIFEALDNIESGKGKGNDRILKNSSIKGKIDEVGKVISTGDGIAVVSGIDNCKNEELVEFSEKAFGIVMNLEKDKTGVILLGDADSVCEGMICSRTGKTIEVPVGRELLGRVVNSLGEPIDGMGPLSCPNTRPVESPAPGIIERDPVDKSLHTGILAIDSMIPIGRGQRELIIGNRQTGKTSIAVDTIINQRGKGVSCIYVAIGQKMSTVVSVVDTLRKHNAMEYTAVVCSSASEKASMQFIAPYAGCAIAEELMYRHGEDVLVVYDDLTKHAQAYRTISLLIRRPPGREAYPGDVFYLHSRLLERAAKLSPDAGNGSITALPIAETKAGDISGYIPTNLISITDGQIYLEEKLFLSGQRPAINVGLSVSRVGGKAQVEAMKKVSASMRINMAQYKELEAFTQFGSELEESTRIQIIKGHNLFEILKQDLHSRMEMHKQIMILYLANTNKFCSFYKEDIKPFFENFMEYMNSLYPKVLEAIKETGKFDEGAEKLTEKAFREYYPLWKAQLQDYGTDE